MHSYLITFHNQPSVVVEAPDASSAIDLCIGKISICAEIPDSGKTILLDKFGLKLVKWPF